MPGGVVALVGPVALYLFASVDLDIADASISAAFSISEGEQAWFRLGWFPSHEGAPESADAAAEASRTEGWWREWSDRCTYQGAHRETVLRSLITLKALTYAPTGGIVAAAHLNGIEGIEGRFKATFEGAPYDGYARCAKKATQTDGVIALGVSYGEFEAFADSLQFADSFEFANSFQFTN